MNMHPSDVLAVLDKIVLCGASRVEFTWRRDALPLAGLMPGEWEWSIEDKHTYRLVARGHAPTFTETAYAAFEALDKNWKHPDHA